MANKFLHIGFMFPGLPRVRDLEPAMAMVCEQWMRYSFNNWIIWTPNDAKQCWEVLRFGVDKDTHFLIAELNLANRYGHLPQWAWDWMDKLIAEEAAARGLGALNALLPPPTK